MRVQKAARKVFEEGPWSKMSASERGRLRNKRADLTAGNKEQFESQAMHSEISWVKSPTAEWPQQTLP